MPRSVRTADGMDQGHAIVGYDIGNFMEECIKVVDAHMFEHADGDNSIIFSCFSPVIQ